ncbi:MAG: hypothetical protein IH936_11285 [Acidobacteria bacterium]|nr:hypothetical protein [Acidobacteriota bacterium]
MRRPTLFVPLLAIAAIGCGAALVACAASADGAEFAFTTAEQDTQRFMTWEREIELTEAQEQVMKDALAPMPAPCCSDNSAYTCCCPCNLAKSWWGLSKHLIAEHGAGVGEVRTTVQEWFSRLSPDGFSGDVCGTGGCNRALRNNGCGGMSATKVNV